MEEKLSSSKEVSAKGLKVFVIVQIFILFLTTIIMLQGGYYTWSLFVAIPFSLGLTIGYYTKVTKSVSWLKKLSILFFLLVAICAALMAIGLEGFICVLMALGLIVLPALLGMFFGYLIRKIYLINFILVVVLLNSSFIVYDLNGRKGFEAEAELSVVINHQPEKIKTILKSKFTFSEHPNFLFKNGISYPKSMQVQNINNKLCLVCSLNNSKVPLPIQELSDSVIRFTTQTNVLVMEEVNPFHKVEAKHQQGYFKIVYGEFRVRELENNKTLLIAKTKYQYQVTPAFYWRWWTNYIVQEMHEHVLSDIKRNAETRGK
ncbi:MAG: hypothetical protein O9302_08095 [Cyclobacteriaceae bacterium]|jgi:hypothetical protein|nr:hypothetical protein [Cyclobacteriaceae bacterium]